ncbi:MAG: DNA polymerase/3'-5' exonuclease PolX [Acidimicrobiia bacterium]|nr:DNA polymerase/3'-5' exonuclease PolX [Acidimicrobiia bacterium]
MVTRSDVLRTLAELAKLTALDEGSPQAFRVRAYESAIQGIDGYKGDVVSAGKNELVSIKGIGASTADKIIEFVTTGSIAKLEALREKYPPGFVELTKIPGLGPKTLKTMRSELGIENLDDLKEAIAQERLRDLPGLGRKSEEKISTAIERLGLHGKDRRTPLYEALPLARLLSARLGGVVGVTDVVPCGSVRRFAETIGDIDLVVATTKPALVHDVVRDWSEVSEVVGSGDTKTSILTREGLQVDVRTVTPNQLGSALLYFTGSKAHNIALRQRAIERGWLLSEYGLFDGDEVLASAIEAEIYEKLDMAWVPPPIREGSGEVDLAAEGQLPHLIERDEIKGDLHYHSDRSGDGRATLEEMIEAGIDRGYDYVAFTDHGEDLAINGSTREQMLEHRDHIRKLQDRYPEIRLLFGCELNIGPNGELDYDAEFRREFDFCVASIHSHFDLDRDRQTSRILIALQDRSVNAIGHLSGRYVGRRPGVELDVDVILEALAVTGVALEVNGALDRLDATAEVARQAMANGVKVVIDTDSHHPRDLIRMDYGVEYARRGWITTDRVVNALPLDEFMAWKKDRSG